MKKMRMFVCIVTICITLAACDPGSYHLDYNELTENVVSVELIEYNNPSQKDFLSWVPDHSSELLPFNHSNLTVISKLGDENIPDFLMQLSESDILYEYYTYDSPAGICLKLTYHNGDFLIIWCDYDNKSYLGYIGIYSEAGEVIDFIGSFSSYYYFESLVNDYFETGI